MEESIATDENRMKLMQAAWEYASLLRTHIHKENRIMFPMAERVLTEPQLEKLYEDFEEHEEKGFGQGRHAELHALLESLQEKYPVQ